MMTYPCTCGQGAQHSEAPSSWYETPLRGPGKEAAAPHGCTSITPVTMVLLLELAELSFVTGNLCYHLRYLL